MKNYFKILGVRADAEPEVIQFAYKALARKYHPDVYKSPDAEEKMKELNEAWEALSDPGKRAACAAHFAHASSSPGTHTHQEHESPSGGPPSSDTMTTITRLAGLLAGRARFGFHGEKSIALLAILHAMRSSTLTGHRASDLLVTRKDTVREFFIRLAKEHGRMKDINASWSVITGGANSEMNRAFQASPEADNAFSKLASSQIDELLKWFEGKY